MNIKASPLTPLRNGEGNVRPSPARRGVGGEAFGRGPGMTKRARRLRNDMTDAERTLWAAIRGDRLGLRFRRQLVFDQRNILDFYAPSIRLAIELDGAQHIERTTQDQLRTSYLVRRGITVLRFWNTEVLLETEAVVQAIADVADELGTFSPLRPGGGPGGRPPPEIAYLKIEFGEVYL